MSNKSYHDSIPAPPWNTFPAMLTDCFKRFADREAVVDLDSRRSYAELVDDVDRCAAGMLALELVEGDRVVIWGENSRQWITAALACWRIGAVVVPLSEKLRPMEIVPLCESSHAPLLFISSQASGSVLPIQLDNYLREQEQTLGSRLPEVIGVVLLDNEKLEADFEVHSWDTFLADPGRSHNLPRVVTQANDPCLIMFTSGTTGLPKGIVFSHRQLLNSVWVIGAIREYTADDRSQLGVPLSHIGGLAAGFLVVFMRGGCLVVCRSLQPGAVFDLIESERLTTIGGVPALLQQWNVGLAQREVNLERVRLIITGAAPVPRNLVEQLTRLGTLSNGYGMTEYPQISTTRGDDDIDAVTTSGFPLPGTELKLVDHGGDPIEAGEIGEIMVRGEGMMLGYLGTPLEETLDADGWLATGDLGSLTHQGRLEIMGRSKDMYIAYGFNVYPADVESLLLKSGLLKSVAVLAQPSKFAGEEGVAFVVPLPDQTVTPRSLQRWARQNMATYKVPARVVICHALPLNPTGKIDKQELLQKLVEETSARDIGK